MSGPSVALTTDDSEDPLAALMEEDEDDGLEEEEVEVEADAILEEAGPDRIDQALGGILGFQCEAELVEAGGQCGCPLLGAGQVPVAEHVGDAVGHRRRVVGRAVAQKAAGKADQGLAMTVSDTHRTLPTILLV